MSRRLNIFFALWFVTQIVLPFTAPFQACNLPDLLGSHGHGTQASHESSDLPTPDDANAPTHAIVSPLSGLALRESITVGVAPAVVAAAPAVQVFTLPSSPRVQQTVLRV